MLKVLLVKTSSLGDVVHNMPAASDIRRRFPEAHIDWVVEEAYAPLLALHRAVHRSIPVAIRRWRRGLLDASTWSEMGAVRREFRQVRYDAVIDSQGLIKSALLARIASGRRHGHDACTARESLAARFYDVTHHVANGQHAVTRNRLLAAAALGYCVEGPVDYGLNIDARRESADAYCVFLHMSGRAGKLWPEARWIELGRALERRGLRCIIPWGSDAERARSERIAAGLHGALVPTHRPLSSLANLLAGARAAVGVDTGLTHLAAALGVPVVALFTGSDPKSDPKLTGVYGVAQARNLGGGSEMPAVAEVLNSLSELKVF